MTDGSGTTRYEYDTADRLTGAVDGAGNTVGYTLDAAGNVTALGYPSGRIVTRSLDPAGRLTDLTDGSGGGISFGYDAAGAITSVTYPNGVVSSYGYDHAGGLTSIRHTRGGSVLASFADPLDPAGHLTAVATVGTPQPDTSYGYDPLGRLTSVDSSPLSYDAIGDALQLDDGATLAYDAASQAQSRTAADGTTTDYTYNPRGDRVTATTGAADTTLSYDQADRLVAYQTPSLDVRYGYDGDGLLVDRTAGASTAHLVYDRLAVAPQLLSDGGHDYLYGPTGPVEQIDTTTGTATYLHGDQLGSTRLLTDTTGGAVGTYSYAAYGAPTHTGTAATVLGYTGQYTDPDNGLVYLRARYYDPATARFLTRDPARVLTGQPYQYANDDPLDETDPLGLWGWNPFQDVGQAWHDTLGQHWRGTVEVVGVAAGVAAAATGVGALVEGSVGIGLLSGGLGVISGAADLPDCIDGHGTDQALNCAGVAAGAVSGVLGGVGAAAQWGADAGILAQDSSPALAGAAIGATGGFGGGVGALTWDVGRGLGDLLNGGPGCEHGS